MNFCMIEPTGDKEEGSIGAFYIADKLRRMGHSVDMITPDSQRYHYDVELFSVHHPEDYPRLQVTPKHGKIRLAGGHVTYNNPRPIIPLVDALCMGDGETWIENAANILEKEKNVLALKDLSGTIVSELWIKGFVLPVRNFEKPLPANPPYLNRPNTLSAAWYIEVARGCPFSCHYCELGHSMPYRYRTREDVLAMLESLDTSLTHKIVFFAPDEASTPHYVEFLEKARSLGLRQAFGSYRLDKIIKMGGVPVDHNQLVRVGVDGLTEETRKRVHKHITDKQIVEYFKLMVAQGHVNFKIFQMFAHSWENPKADFAKWERLMNIVFAIPLEKAVSLRVKWTPLIPQPVTPLAEDKAIYHQETARLIKAWHERVRQPKSQPGWHVECDGIMSAKSHARQITLTHGDETSLLEGAKYINHAWRKQ